MGLNGAAARSRNGDAEPAGVGADMSALFADYAAARQTRILCSNGTKVWRDA